MYHYYIQCESRITLVLATRSAPEQRGGTVGNQHVGKRAQIKFAFSKMFNSLKAKWQ
jgi:hypothetical protein